MTLYIKTIYIEVIGGYKSIKNWLRSCHRRQLNALPQAATKRKIFMKKYSTGFKNV